MKITGLLTDEAILAELGGRIGRRRIDLQLTQAALAEQAGIAKRTVERVEAGAPTQTSSLVRVFRVLGLLEELDRLVPETGPGPLEQLRRQGKARRRVSRARRPGDARPWTWEDDA